MSNIKEVHSKPRLHVSVNLLFGAWQPSCATPPSSSTVVVVVVVRTRPRAIPLAMITMRKSTHGFPFVSHMSTGLRLVALRAAGAPLSLQRLSILNSRRDLLEALSHSRSLNFPPYLACSLIAVFSFLVRFFRFFELVHGHFHSLGLFIPKRITQGRCLVADQLSN